MIDEMSEYRHHAFRLVFKWSQAHPWGRRELLELSPKFTIFFRVVSRILLEITTPRAIFQDTFPHFSWSTSRYFTTFIQLALLLWILDIFFKLFIFMWRDWVIYATCIVLIFFVSVCCWQDVLIQNCHICHWLNCVPHLWYTRMKMGACRCEIDFRVCRSELGIYI